METKQERADKVNELVRVIGDCGRHFFKHRDRYARIEIDHRGRVWWIDDYTGKRIYTHYELGSWKGFSHGGTLRDLVRDFRDYITKAKQLRANSFGPWPEWLCHGDLWGYGTDMNRVREAANSLGLVAP